MFIDRSFSISCHFASSLILLSSFVVDREVMWNKARGFIIQNNEACLIGTCLSPHVFTPPPMMDDSGIMHSVQNAIQQHSEAPSTTSLKSTSSTIQKGKYIAKLRMFPYDISVKGVYFGLRAIFFPANFPNNLFYPYSHQFYTR